ncbi:MAG: hypothetical protein AAF610_12510 [Pseudomonadota bacterium]
MNKIVLSIVTAASLSTAACVDAPTKRNDVLASPDVNELAKDANRLQSKLDDTQRRTIDGGDAAIVRHELYLETIEQSPDADNIGDTDE